MPMLKKAVFVCKRCGLCCKEEGGMLFATANDMARWWVDSRQDILKYARVVRTPNGVTAVELWVSPRTNKLLKRCPFYRKPRGGQAECLIHTAKPFICRRYPATRIVPGECMPPCVSNKGEWVGGAK